VVGNLLPICNRSEPLVLPERQLVYQNFKTETISNTLRGCLESPANAKFTERGTGFMPALRPQPDCAAGAARL